MVWAGSAMIAAWRVVAYSVRGVAGAGEGDVAGFAVETGGSDDVDVVAGESLGFVDGGGVAVVDVAAVDVVRCRDAGVDRCLVRHRRLCGGG